MKMVTLIFPSPKALWEFLEAANPGFVHINPKNLSLTCNCSIVDVDLAVKKFAAIIQESKTH